MATPVSVINVQHPRWCFRRSNVSQRKQTLVSASCQNLPSPGPCRLARKCPWALPHHQIEKENARNSRLLALVAVRQSIKRVVLVIRRGRIAVRWMHLIAAAFAHGTRIHVGRRHHLCRLVKER